MDVLYIAPWPPAPNAEFASVLNSQYKVFLISIYCWSDVLNWKVAGQTLLVEKISPRWLEVSWRYRARAFISKLLLHRASSPIDLLTHTSLEISKLAFPCFWKDAFVQISKNWFATTMHLDDFEFVRIAQTQFYMR